MDIKPIRTKHDYEQTLKQIERLMDARKNTPEGDRLEVLSTLAEAYEARHYPMDAPNPVEAILFVMEQRGLTRHDLEPFIGSRARVSEILNRRRPLTLPMIRKLHHALQIPAEILLH